MSVEKESIDTTFLERRMDRIQKQIDVINRKFRVLIGLLKDKKIIGTEIIIETINKSDTKTKEVIKWYLEKELGKDASST